MEDNLYFTTFYSTRLPARNTHPVQAYHTTGRGRGGARTKGGCSIQVVKKREVMLINAFKGRAKSVCYPLPTTDYTTLTLHASPVGRTQLESIRTTGREDKGLLAIAAAAITATSHTITNFQSHVKQPQLTPAISL